MTTPEVSVCIPTYEQTTYLKNLFDSLLIQSFKDFEIIVSDDSQSNHVALLVEEYKPQFSQSFTFIQNKTRKGSPENWNVALKQAKGRLIKIMHHDDWFTYQDSLECFVRGFNSNQTSLFCSATLNYYPQKDSYYVRQTTNEQINLIRDSPVHLFFSNYIGVPSCVIYQNKTHQDFDPQLIWLVDVEFYLRILTHNTKITYINKPLVTTCTLAQHNITNQFVSGNPIELDELFYIYIKIKTSIPSGMHKRVLKFLGHKIIQYKYTDLNKIQTRYPEIQLPKWFIYVVRFNSVSTLMAKLLLKLV